MTGGCACAGAWYVAGNPGRKIPLPLVKNGEGSSCGGLKAVGAEGVCLVKSVAAGVAFSMVADS